MSGTEVRRSGFVAVAGRPNAGKSTLVNRIVGRHVAIVSDVAQTTRRTVRAAVQVGDAQVVLVDLPGSQRPVDRMTERMQHTVERSFADVDAVLWVIDASVPPGGGERKVASLVFEQGRPVVIALNKIDRVSRNDLLGRIAAIDALIDGRPYHAIVPISALDGDGVDEILAEVAGILPEGPAWFDETQVTDMRDEERIAEYVREAMLDRLRDELPHATFVTVDELEEEDDGRLIIACTIWVERDSQVGIVVGHHGAGVRDVGTEARRRIQAELGVSAHLELRVKVRRRWRDDDAWLERAGL